MKDKVVCATILLIYCVPYVFFAMYGDAEANTMLLYGLMIVAMGLLCFGCVKSKNFPALLIGNVLSFVVSCICIYNIQIEKWEWYFKPFSALSLAVIVSVIALIIQIVVWKIVTMNYR